MESLEEATGMPQTISKDERTFYKIKWAEAKDGEEIYLFCRKESRASVIGPFEVVSKERRQLMRVNKVRVRDWFYQYPEELYRELIN